MNNNNSSSSTSSSSASPSLTVWPQSGQDPLEKIATQVNAICCFGGSNKGGAKKFTQFINEKLKNLAQFKAMDDLSKIALDDAKKKQELEENSKSLKEGFPSFAILINAWEKYCSTGFSGKFYFNPMGIKLLLQDEMTVEAQKAANGDNESYYQTLKTLNSSDIAPLISELTHGWVIDVKNHATALQSRDVHEMLAGDKYCIKLRQEPPAQEKKLVMKYIINEVKSTCFNFGFGNCHLMAELAFLLAIQQIPQTPIRLMQFSGNGYEELNAVVIGNWSDANCRILAPWYSEKPIVWKGNFKNTPELAHYSKTHTLFTVCDNKEQLSWKAFLQAENFDADNLADENKNNNRKNYKKAISKQSKIIYQLIQKHVMPNATMQNAV